MYDITRVNVAALHVLSVRASPLRALLTDQWVSTLTEGETTDRCSPVLDGMTGDTWISGVIPEGVCHPSYGVTQTECCRDQT